MLDLVVKNVRLPGESLASTQLFIEDGLLSDVVRVPSGNNIASAKTVDFGGALVFPGFVDPHSHADRRIDEPSLSSKKADQGIMVEVVGNCGLGPSPNNGSSAGWQSQLIGLGIMTRETHLSFPEYLEALRTTNAGVAPRVHSLVPYGAVRAYVSGLAEKLTDNELDSVHSLLSDALDAGGVGVSMGLVYPPNQSSTMDELHRTLSSLYRSPSRLLAVHIRSQSSRWMAAIEEVLRLAQSMQLRLLISHLCVGGQSNWWKTEWVLDRLDAARQQGIDVWFDHHPYTAGATSFFQLLPPEMISRIRSGDDPREMQDYLRSTLSSGYERKGWDNYLSFLSPENILITSCPDSPDLVGQTIQSLMDDWDVSMEETVVEILALTHGRAGIVLEHLYSEQSILDIASVPFGCLSTDSVHVPLPHPRLLGTFPYAFARLVASGHISELEFARRASWRTSHILGLGPTSTIDPGSDANLVFIDDSKFDHLPVYQDPYSKGIEGVKGIIRGGILQDLP